MHKHTNKLQMLQDERAGKDGNKKKIKGQKLLML